MHCAANDDLQVGEFMNNNQSEMARINAIKTLRDLIQQGTEHNIKGDWHLWIRRGEWYQRVKTCIKVLYGYSEVMYLQQPLAITDAGTNEAYAALVGKLYGYAMDFWEQSLNVPIQIQAGLEDFWEHYPDASKVGMLIMPFHEGHNLPRVESFLKQALRQFGLILVRVDNGAYDDSLWGNISVYMHGCGFAITILDSSQAGAHNSNVMLETGFMLGLNKPVCILKDKQVKIMSDLVGQLYKEFDSTDPVSVVNPVVRWLREKKLISIPS